MAKKILCERCKAQISRNEIYVPQIAGKWHMAKLCMDCFQKVLCEQLNGNGSTKGGKL